MSRWIDCSVPLSLRIARWPGDAPPRLRVRKSLRRGDRCNGSALALSSHAGTHMDAPFHFIAGGATIERLPLDAVAGPARVLAVRGDRVREADLRRARLRRGERVLFRTRNSARRWWERPFDPGYAFVSEEAARWLAARRARCVGIDYLSVAGFREDPAATHRALLGAGVWIIEGLDLTRVRPGRCELICLPLKVVGADGAPARAIVRPIS